MRTVGAALVLQVVIGGIRLWLPPGRWVAEKVAFGVHNVMAY
ncbi:Na+ dependent nucleoside transporter N-terminal domain-containing protein [Marimonas sp. MJW-29]|uniref:Na+ dependent nucleoside transporter N-terminal domain-containing protein n=1 Tax=Sulfitobacter sediminis TaxID=3234186 RepID=A0ABV3RX38_9RHOB